MPNFRNFEDVLKHIKKDILDGMNEVGEEVQEEVKRQIDVDVYSHDPSKYKRTGELQDSVVYSQPKQDGNKITTQVFHDTSMIGSYEKGYQHYSKYPNGHDPDVSKFIPEWVHDGKSGNAFGYGFWTLPRPYMDNAYDNLERSGEHVDVLKRELKKKGYDVK